MKILLLIVTVFLFLINPRISFPQNLTYDEKEILTFQDKRSLGENDELLNYLNSAVGKINFMTLYSLANIADTGSVNKTNAFISQITAFNNNSDLISEYAFYLGQTPCADSKFQLVDMYEDQDVVYKLSYPEIINSTGKTGDENDLNKMISKFSKQELNETEGTAVYRALAMAIAGFALRKIKNENSVDALKQMANINDTAIQRNIAYALWRTGDKDLLEAARQEIYTLAESEDAQTRMWAFNAMGKLQDKLLLMYTLESFGSETDWRVKVNMLNTILNFKLDSLEGMTDQVYSVISDGIGDENELISLTAINVIGNLFADINKSDKYKNKDKVKFLSEKIMKEFIYTFDSLTPKDLISWRQRSALANSMSKIYRDESKEVLLRAYATTDDYRLKSGIVSAFGNFENGQIYKEIRELISADVQNYNKLNPNIDGAMIGSKDLAELYRGFVDMLTNLDDKVDAKDQNIMRLIFTEFAGSKDPLITDVCLSALRDSLYLKYRDETASVMQFDYNELESPADDDIKLIYIDAMKDLYNDDIKNLLTENLLSKNYEIAKASAGALEIITGEKKEFTAKPRYDFDWDYIDGLSEKKIITVLTNKGKIKIELLPEVAPFTVMNFLKLAGRNYYDSTVFHRVVPNFVIQGGDPTGTGYGGPGYSIRGEYSPLTFEEGMVGMASSGKDTEGSQFFITHSATPHLDGKYTIFGKVLEGMEVVEMIMVGDYIIDITN